MGNTERNNWHESDFRREQYIPFAEAFGVVYPGLSPVIRDTICKILSNEITVLQAKGIEATWVRGGAREFAINYLIQRGLTTELKEKWGIFDPNLTGKPEEGRRNLAQIGLDIAALSDEEIQKLNQWTVKTAQKFSNLPDIDIKIGTRQPRVDLDLDQELIDCIDYGVIQDPSLSFRNQQENSDGELPYFLCDVVDTAGIKKANLKAITRKVSTSAKRNATFRFTERISKQDGPNKEGRELISLQFGTMPETAPGSLIDKRNEATYYSNERISLQLVVDEQGKVLINTSNIARWADSLNSPITLESDIHGVPYSEAALACRSGRIACHMLPKTDDLHELIPQLYTKPVFDRIRNVFDHLKAYQNNTEDPQRESLRRSIYQEFLAMASTDPYFACMWAIQTHAADFIFGVTKKKKLIDALFSDRMVLTFASPEPSSLGVIPTPVEKRHAADFHKSREIFLHSNIQGLRLLYDALFNIYNKDNKLTAEELNTLFTQFNLPKKYEEEEEAVEIGGQKADFTDETISPALQALLKRRFPKNHPKSQANYRTIMQCARDYLNVLLIRTRVDPMLNITDIYDDFINNHSSKEAREMFKLFINAGIISQFGNQHVVMTPERIARRLLTVNWQGDLTKPKYEDVRRHAIKEIYIRLITYNKNLPISRRRPDNVRARQATVYVDKFAPLEFPNILCLERLLPDAEHINEKTYSLKNFQESDPNEDVNTL